MSKEMLTVHVGQAGVQTSQALWELVCLEHGVDTEGFVGVSEENDSFYRGEHLETVFYKTKADRCVPRAILVDLEPTVVDEIRLGTYRNIWNPINIINQKEDAASNYARGYYTSGKAFLIIVLDRINKEIERCDNLSAFEIVHSFAGGTGSGFTALLYETINELYGKKFKFSLGVFPSPTVSEIMVEPYNAVLHTSSTLNTEDCVVAFDNESLFNKSVKKFNVQQPTFSLMNRLISQMFSSISLSHRYRFFGSQHADVTELLTNLVPYPRIHFPVMSYSPLMSFTEKSHEQFTCSRLTNDVFHDDSHVIQCSLKENKFMSCCMLYRGLISPKPVIDAIAKIKGCRDINFVDWCPTGFKIGINTCPPIQIPQCEQAIGDNALCMISGNTAIRGCWGNVLRKFDMLMSKRAFVHWYVGEGLEEGEFLDSRENIQTLILDYEELSNQGIDTSTSDEKVDNVSHAKKGHTNINNEIPFKKTTSVLSKINNVFRTQNNQSHFKRNEVYLDSILEPIQDKKHIIKKRIKLNKSLNKTRQLPSSTIQSTICGNSKDENIKFSKDILTSSSITDKISNKNHNRFKTKNLEVKDIGQTVAKYLIENDKLKRNSLTYSRNTIQPYNTNKLLKDSNMSTNQSFTFTQNEFLGKYKLMKNNNKDQSLRTSSSTGSFKSVRESENKTPSNFLRKSKGKWKIIDQLLYKTNNQEDLNVNLFDLCTDFSSNLKDITSIERKKTFKSSNLKSLSIELHGSLNLDDELSHLVEESKKSIESYADVETKISQDFKVKNLDFSHLKIFNCDPTIQ